MGIKVQTALICLVLRFRYRNRIHVTFGVTIISMQTYFGGTKTEKKNL